MHRGTTGENLKMVKDQDLKCKLLKEKLYSVTVKDHPHRYRNSLFYII